MLDADTGNFDLEQEKKVLDQLRPTTAIEVVENPRIFSGAAGEVVDFSAGFPLDLNEELEPLDSTQFTENFTKILEDVPAGKFSTEFCDTGLLNSFVYFNDEEIRFLNQQKAFGDFVFPNLISAEGLVIKKADKVVLGIEDENKLPAFQGHVADLYLDRLTSLSDPAVLSQAFFVSLNAITTFESLGGAVDADIMSLQGLATMQKSASKLNDFQSLYFPVEVFEGEKADSLAATGVSILVDVYPLTPAMKKFQTRYGVPVQSSPASVQAHLQQRKLSQASNNQPDQRSKTKKKKPFWSNVLSVFAKNKATDMDRAAGIGRR